MLRRTPQPPQSGWCWLGFHRWLSMERPVTRNGIRYIGTYNRCDREGCRRYPTWLLMDLRRPSQS